MQGTKYAGANKQQLTGLFNYLEVCLEQVVKDNELGALKQALKVHVTSRITHLSGKAWANKVF